MSLLSRLAQLVERKTLNLVVVGSSPTVGVLFAFSFFFSGRVRGLCSYRDPTPMSRLAQLVERKTLNLVVVGSSPTVGVSNFFFARCIASARFVGQNCVI